MSGENLDHIHTTGGHTNHIHLSSVHNSHIHTSHISDTDIYRFPVHKIHTNRVYPSHRYVRCGHPCLKDDGAVFLFHFTSARCRIVLFSPELATEIAAARNIQAKKNRWL
ncbi:Uncharacterized protein Rs2_02846 [Raphanus sativus]|nr:Uncharacterized protein Rs2_02846 [Raphanus sativus]